MSMTATDTAASAPGETITGLPASAYTDQAFLALEQQKLFASSWVCIGTIDDVPNPGDARPLRVAASEILMVRDSYGTVRVLHNFCRHRGHPIVTEPAHGLKRLVCPYHAWAYDLDGRLARAPHFDGAGKHRTGDEAARLPGLKLVRSALWHRLVFANLSGDAEPLDAGRCREHVHVFFVGDNGVSAPLKHLRETAVARFQEFNEEDIAIIEALQSGFAANTFDGGCFSPYFDRNIHHFQELVVKALGGADAP